MAIWHHPADLAIINARGRGTLVEGLGIEITAIGEDSLTGTMPVDQRTVQPQGILHGGASVALAETLGSMASYLCLDPARKYCVGMTINSSHLRSISRGKVTGVATPVHLGMSTHVWNIEITGDHGKLISVSRLTMAILDKVERNGQ